MFIIQDTGSACLLSLYVYTTISMTKTQYDFYQNATGKTCGSWHRLPRRYRRQLRRDEIHAQLTNEDGIVVAGRIGKFYGLSSGANVIKLFYGRNF